MNNKHRAMGLWKFKDTVPMQELGAVAEQWAVEDPHYLQLYIRKASKDQNGIGFTYELPEENESHDEYFDRTSDFLRRKFGNDLVGWDIASDVWVIK